MRRNILTLVLSISVILLSAQTDDARNNSKANGGWLKEAFNIWPKIGVSVLPTTFKANGNSETFAKVIPNIGVDIELKMPWIENLYLHSNPTYYAIDFEKEVDVFLVPTTLDLKLHSISIPLGFRYHYPIEGKGILFANIGFEVLYDLQDEMIVTPPALEVLVDSKNTMIYGLGFKKDEWSIELEYKPDYRIFNGSVETSITRIGLRVGYQIF